MVNELANAIATLEVRMPEQFKREHAHAYTPEERREAVRRAMLYLTHNTMEDTVCFVDAQGLQKAEERWLRLWDRPLKVDRQCAYV